MPDQPPSASNPPSPAQPSRGSEPSLLNQAQLASIAKTEQICRIALRPEFLGELITAPEPGVQAGPEEITEAGINALLGKCEQARETSGQAADATSDKEDETEEQQRAKAKLLEAIRFIQARARQKHHASGANTLSDYGIGQNLEVSRAVLEQYGKSIYDKTATDQLPKVTAAKREELKTALKAYQDSKTGQTAAKGTAGQLRKDRDALVKEIIEGRMRIQFAADAEWPFTHPANHPIRMQFQLPASRPFVG